MDMDEMDMDQMDQMEEMDEMGMGKYILWLFALFLIGFLMRFYFFVEYGMEMDGDYNDQLMEG